MDYRKEDLERLILVEKMPYIQIGKMYGVSDTCIKKHARKLGIALPQKRKINPSEKEHHYYAHMQNKKIKLYERRVDGRKLREGHNKLSYAHICEYCGKEYMSDSHYQKYCSQECCSKHRNTVYITEWKQGKRQGNEPKHKFIVSRIVRKYLFDKYNNKCQLCGWGETNQHTNLIPLQIHHVDGNPTNNQESNLQLLCPNCHALTENFGSRNKNQQERTKYFGKDKIK